MQITRTLLADDHALVRAGLRDALTNVAGLEIIGEAGNGRDLLSLVDQEHPDLLVMDVNMPDFEPVEAVHKMKASCPGMKILVVSAYDDQAYVVGLLSAGVNGYHLKDQPLSDLQLAVQRILDGGRWISDPLVNRLVDQHHTAPPQNAPALTRRQRELLYLLTQGYNNQKIAWVMDLSIKTVENHLTALYRALGVESRLEANNYASRHPELLAIPEKEKPQAGGHTSGALTVLLVDDNPRYRSQLGKLVSKSAPLVSIYEAEDSQEALRIATQVHPQLAFIDIVLGDEDGIQCAKRLKTASPTTRMILVSAYPDREFRRMSMNAGAVAFLDKKDMDAAAVRQVVEDTLQR